MFKIRNQRFVQLRAVNQTFVVNQRLDRGQAVRHVCALNRLNAGEVIVRAARGHVHAAAHAVVNDAGEKRRRQQLRVRPLNDLAAMNHAFKEEIHLRIERCEHVFIRSEILQRARVRAHLLAGQGADAVVQRKFQRFHKVKHGRVAPTEVVAHGRELHATDDCVVLRVRVRNALALERGNHRFVVKELRHAASLANDLGAARQKMFARTRKDPRGEIRLRQEQVLLCAEEQKAQLVFGGFARLVLPADGNVKANREPREILRAAGASQIDNLIKLEEQTFENLQRVLFRQRTGSDVLFIIRIEVLIHPPRRKRRGVALHLKNDV